MSDPDWGCEPMVEYVVRAQRNCVQFPPELGLLKMRPLTKRQKVKIKVRDILNHVQESTKDASRKICRTWKNI